MNAERPTTSAASSLPGGADALATAPAYSTSSAPSASVLSPPQATPARVITSQSSGGDDQFTTSDAPYAIAQATPTCSEAVLKSVGTLPPIATARPLGHISEIQSHLPGGSNIPLSNETHQGNNGNLPYVTVMTMAPSAVMSGADADLDDSRFQFLQPTRWMATIMLAYYLATFFFVQPFMIGAMGIVTGFIGYLSARPPVDFRRIKWVRWYVWLNYAMMALNMWLLVIAFIAIGTSTSSDGGSDSLDADDASGSSWMADTSSYSDFSTYYTTNLGVYVGVLVGVNMVMHLRGLRTAQLLLAELVAIGFAWPIVATAAAR